MHRLLLAYDGSVPSEHAAQQAVELARLKNATVDVLVVGELLPNGYGSVAPVAENEIYEDLAKAGVERVRSAGIEAHGHVVWGNPAELIVDTAEKERHDAIVMGHRGLGGLASLLLGSTAKHVIDHAPCSVLIVR